MQFARLNDVTLHYRFRPGKGVPMVFLNSLGTDFRIWDEVIAALDASTPVLCLDKRGHGLSNNAAITMDLLARDVSALMDHLGLGASVVCGVSVGGMIAQSLAARRPDLVSGLVLCCTGARIGDDDGWNARIDTVRGEGIAAMAEAILERWFSRSFRTEREAEFDVYRNMLIRTSPEGYAGVCAAIRDSDLTAHAPGIEVPTQCIAGSEDLATPPELVQSLARQIDGAGYEVIEGCGHLPCIEASQTIARAVGDMQARLA